MYPSKEANEVYIVMDNEETTGSESILGVFEREVDAKLFVADYVLDKEINTCYLSLTRKEIR